MGSIFVISDEIEQGLSEDTVRTIDIDSDGDRGGFLFNFVVSDIFGGIGHVFFDSFDFVGIFAHEEIENGGSIFKYKIDDTGCDKNIDH